MATPFSGPDDSLPRLSTAEIWQPSQERIIQLIAEAEIDSCSLIPWGSNYTFLITLQHPESGTGYAVYKPQQGETPLYDFPEGTLLCRERAAYVLSEALGWNIVPPTVLRDGPYGAGMVQLFVDSDPNAHYFTFGLEIPDEARRIALFDWVINNTDRKAGHLLRDPEGRVWAIDHGLTFHSTPKMRTVIWEFAGEPIPTGLLHNIESLLAQWDEGNSLLAEIKTLLSPREYAALRRRMEQILTSGVYPHPTSYRSMPWPSV